MEEDDLIFNFEFLRQHGISFLQQLSGNIWTDYNLHDPGITILEHLCFAFTDLAYRTDFSIQDILAGPDKEIINRHNSFFSARKILSSNPVSISDKRKYLIDSMPEIDNIWLEPVIEQRGLFFNITTVYNTTIQLHKDFDPEIRGVADQGVFENEPVNIEAFKTRVKQKLVATRNLCEDFNDVTILKPAFIEINTGILIESEASPEEVLANICLRLEALVTPAIKYATEKDLKAKGFRTEEIYQGPELTRGIITDDALSDLKTVVDPVEFVKTILSVAGVVNIMDLKLTMGDNTTENKPFSVRDGYYPYLKYKPGNIRLFRNRVQLEVHESVFKFHYYRIKQVANKDFITALYEQEEKVGLKGKWRDLSKYHSIQEYFPLAYGLGANGLPDDASAERKAAVKQLKGYLMLFEQTLLNYLAQLGNINNFFSVDVEQPTVQSTLYFQPAFDLPGAEDIIKDLTGSSAPTDATRNAFIEHLGQAMETDEEYRKKKNRVMDHLLARFNLSLPDLPVTAYIKYYGQQNNGRADAKLRWKSSLLLQLRETGYYRFRAFDYLGSDNADFEGFKKNMYRFLFIAGPYERSLTESFNNAYFNIVPSSATGARETAMAAPHIHHVHIDNEETGIHELTDYVTADSYEAGDAGSLFNNQTIAVFTQGTEKGNYKVLPDPLSTNRVVLAFKTPAPDNANRWSIVSRHNNHVDAEDAAMKLVDHFRKISIASEGFHMVEHMLLRPDADAPIYRHVLVDYSGKKIMWQEQLLNLRESQQRLQALINGILGSEPHPPLNTLRALFDGWATIVDYKNGDNQKYYGTFDANETDLREVFAMLKGADIINIYYKLVRCIVKQARSFYVDKDFFSGKLSFVIPLWPARFQDARFKSHAQSLIAQSCPVFIQPHFVWLHIHRMNHFEAVYFPWLRSLKENDPSARQHLKEAMVQLVANEKYIVRVNPQDE
jgi:hypothetical protein